MDIHIVTMDLADITTLRSGKGGSKVTNLEKVHHVDTNSSSVSKG